jgi:sigma-B regulation protein RsbU (phosphoserine phosphatase)
METAKHPPPAEITVLTPMIAPIRHALSKPGVVTLGRASECTVPIKDRYLSRRHAEIVPGDGSWVLKDCGSANGTFLNGTRVERDSPLKSGDRIKLGDTEIVFQADQSTDRFVSIPDARMSATISIPLGEIVDHAPKPTDKSLERLSILNALAVELIEDQPVDQLFGFILDRIMEHLKPSRAAIGVMAEDGKSIGSVEVRRKDPRDTAELRISQTLLAELVEERKALAFMDISVDEKLSRAMSIVAQGIHSVLCAPIMIGESVVGILYVDFLFMQRTISEEEVRLVGQIARYAAVKLENARLRESALQKRFMDEELKTAYTIQRRLLPDRPPELEGYTLSGLNRPCRTVSGDYYDFVVQQDGTIYFVIADVSGKGVTAALLMAGLQAAFRIFTKDMQPSPADLVRQLNVALKENLPQSKFVTLFTGRLFPETGEIEFSNAGHNPPLVVRKDSVDTLNATDILLGMFSHAEYRNQRLVLNPGDALVLYTDGVTEAAREDDDEFGMQRLEDVVRPLFSDSAAKYSSLLESAVLEFVGSEHCADDVTMVVISRNA